MRGSCDACGYQTEVEEYGPTYGEAFERRGRRSLFCRVCTSTLISQVETRPEELNAAKLFRSIGHVANIILDAIESAKEEILDAINGRRT